jgi:protein transport protein SEC61 subunit beta
MAGTAAGATNVGAGRPAGARGPAGPGSTLRNRKSSSKPTTNTTAVRQNDNSMWKFYTEDSPGIKVGPVPVLIMSLAFIASVFILHIWGKFTRSRGAE